LPTTGRDRITPFCMRCDSARRPVRTPLASVSAQCQPCNPSSLQRCRMGYDAAAWRQRRGFARLAPVLVGAAAQDGRSDTYALYSGGVPKASAWADDLRDTAGMGVMLLLHTISPSGQIKGHPDYPNVSVKAPVYPMFSTRCR